VSFRFELLIESDFADIFEVKTGKLSHAGSRSVTWSPEQAILKTEYRWDKFARGVQIRAVLNTSPMQHGDGRLSFEIQLDPRATWHTCLYVEPILANGEVLKTDYDCYQFENADTPMDKLERAWHRTATVLKSSDPVLEATWARSVEDLGALRMYVQDVSRELWIPEAGLPWFLALFGRDPLITALQSLIVSPNLAFGALMRLGKYQATARDPYLDMEPGKILHELRVGPLATNGLIPHCPYYGTADATILYLIALSECYQWLGDLDFVRASLPTAEACLRWIDEEGDRDGDGFQEYASTSPVGYHNMGWKDSADAIVFPNGLIVEPPITLVELQGYVFDAKRRMATLFEALGESERARELRAQAERLRQRVEEVFWIESEGTYGLCLGADKCLVPTIASNAGHLLWSGLPTPDRARRVVQRLLEPDMYSGWGIRTLSNVNPAYNPYEYQRGSVWPHDNSIIAKGMARYGHHSEAARVARGIFDAASFFHQNRLPEVFAGLPRDENFHFPVRYVGANVPQAWAAASVFQFVQALLGLEADAAHGILWANPVLPDWLGTVELSGIVVGKTAFDLRIQRGPGPARVEVLRQSGKTSEVKQGKIDEFS
jgi:glycogen debranching enzyme